MGLSKRSVATVLAVIKTDDGYWIAADSKRIIGTGGTDSVCKIHETKIGVIAKASADKGLTKKGSAYSLDAEIADLVEKSQSPAEFKESLRTSYEQELWDQLAYQIKLPNLKKEQIKESHFPRPLPPEMMDVSFRQVILIAIEEGRLTMRQLMAGFQSKLLANDEYSYFVDVTDWRKIDETLHRPEDASHPSLHQFANVVEVEETDAYIRLHPQQVLQSLLKRASDTYPSGVGPPFSLAHISLSHERPTRIRLTWLSPGNCPSWNLRPYTTNFIK